MVRAKILSLTLVMVFLVLDPKMECQPVFGPFAPIRPLCLTQFALVSHSCSMLPYTPLPPPSPPLLPPPPPADDNDARQHGHGHGHGHRHGHRHGHGHHETPVEQDCCRWLKEVDPECVCDLLVRLPPFLSRPVHQYSVIVDDSCNATYVCGGRVL